MRIYIGARRQESYQFHIAPIRHQHQWRLPFEVGDIRLFWPRLQQDADGGAHAGADTEAWPKSPKGFADALRRCAPALRLIRVAAKIGDKPTKHGYPCTLRRLAEPVPDAPSGSHVGIHFDVHHLHHVHPAATSDDVEVI